MVGPHQPRHPRTKVMSLSEVIAWRATRHGQIVFTNGVFDLLHPGHIDVLFGARAFGAALIVGVNSDASVRRLKGPTRPVRSAAERVHVLAGLEAVDAVVVFDDDTPLSLVTAVMPDVIVKGGDYATDTIVGAAQVLARGGRVEVIPITAGQSTTSIIEKLRG